MRLSQNGARFIASFEGIRLKRYNDPAPGRHCTVGIGHLLHHGPCDGRSGEFDLPNEQAAWALLIEDVARSYGPAVERLSRRLNQNEFDALVSFTYNIGTGGYEQSTVRRLVNFGGSEGAIRAAFNLWTKAGGVVLPGLVRRRKAEADLFFTPARDEPEPEPVDPDPLKLRGRHLLLTLSE